MYGTSRRFFIAAASAVLLLSGHAHAADPAIGVWKLNVAKSKISPGPAPQSMTIKWEPAGDAIKFTAESTAADGKTLRTEYTAKVDGKEYPMIGSPTTDTISLKRIDANTVERTDKKAGKVTVVILRKTAEDGKSMTVSVKGTNAAGQAVDALYLFEKQ